MKNRLVVLTIMLSLLVAVAASAPAQTSAGRKRVATGRKRVAPRRGRVASRRKRTVVPAKPAAESAAKLPSADQIFAKYAQALGGEAAYRKLTSRVGRGTFTIAAAGLTAPMEIYQKAPNKNVTLITLPGFGAITQGYDGKVAFDQQPTSGLRELGGKELAKRQRAADFYNDLNYGKQYTKTIVTGVETVGTAQAYRVDATTPEGDIEKLYFDKQSGLLVRKDEASETPEGLIPTQSYFEDYRTIDGIKYPFTARITSPAVGVITVTLTELKHNVPIDDTKFNKPTAQ